jgi:hypothetical protein
MRRLQDLANFAIDIIPLPDFEERQTMPTRNISLTPERALKLEALRRQIKAGVDALERGEFVEIDGSDLDGYLRGVTATPGKGAG